jgi:hypothetical protein
MEATGYATWRKDKEESYLSLSKPGKLGWFLFLYFRI